MKRALVIGGSGFLGRHTISGLSSQGYEIIALEHRSPLIADHQTRIIKGGIEKVDRQMIREIRPDLVFHSGRPAWPALRAAGRFMAARYAARLNRRLMVELAESGHPLKLIFASGSLMYGPSPEPPDEDAPLKPSSFAAQYYRGEMPVLQAMRADQIQVNIIRFPWLLGNGSWFEWFYLRTMQQSNAVPLFGNGENLMEVIDIRDAVRLALKFTEGSGASSVFNIISDRPVSQIEFATAVSSASGLPVKDYREIFPGRIEKAALQAFSYNIVLKTKYRAVLEDFKYTPLAVTLARVMEENRPR